VDVASQLTPRVAYKLVTYTFGSLLHLFLQVLIVGQRRLGGPGVAVVFGSWPGCLCGTPATFWP